MHAVTSSESAYFFYRTIASISQLIESFRTMTGTFVAGYLTNRKAAAEEAVATDDSVRLIRFAPGQPEGRGRQGKAGGRTELCRSCGKFEFKMFFWFLKFKFWFFPFFTMKFEFFYFFPFFTLKFEIFWFFEIQIYSFFFLQLSLVFFGYSFLIFLIFKQDFAVFLVFKVSLLVF